MISTRTVPNHVAPEQIFDFDIYADPRITADVQGSYAEVLKDAPDLFFTPANGGHWIVRRLDLILGIVKDSEHFSTREQQIPRVLSPPLLIPLSLDPPGNFAYRQVLMPKFSASAIQALEPKLRYWAKLLIDEVVKNGACDFSHDIAARYPVSVFMELMGMPHDRLREFHALACSFFEARTEAEFAHVVPEIHRVMGNLISLRSRQPGDDLVSHLLSVEVHGRKLTLDEMQSMCFLLFLGGMDTVANVAGFTYQQLAHDVALQQRLSAEPVLIPHFVEEALRMYGVVSNPRIVAQDCERFGVAFREGDMVLCVLAMGGRDDRVNNNPNVFNIDRPQRSYIAFSSGPHVCLGHILARAELRILTEEWLKRIPTFHAAPGARHKYRLGCVNALESLPLQWSTA
jgi:cytochrome P450